MTQSNLNTQGDYVTKILQKEHDLEGVQVKALKSFWNNLVENQEISKVRRKRYVQSFFYLMDECFSTEADPKNPINVDLNSVQDKLNQVNRSPDTKADMVLSWNRFLETLEKDLTIGYEIAQKTAITLKEEEEA